MNAVDWGTIKEHIIRTWAQLEEEGLSMLPKGSVSCRVDGDSFFYTGDELRAGFVAQDEIQRVRIKFAVGMAQIHAAIYKARPNVGAVAFTRQCLGSSLGVLQQEGLAAEDSSGNQLKIRVAPFTIPGSDAQRLHVRRLSAKEDNLGFIILANQGVLAFGEGTEEMVSSAVTLERYAALYLSEICHTTVSTGLVRGFDSKRDGACVTYKRDDTPARVRAIHERIYAARPDITAIIQDRSPAALSVSRLGDRLYPIYDDLVTLCGSDIRIPKKAQTGRLMDSIFISGKANVSFCYDDGAYCFGRGEAEAFNAACACERACVAQLAGARSGGAHVIGRRYFGRLRKL